MPTFEEFVEQKHFTKALSKVPFLNASTAVQQFEAWLCFNDSTLHRQLFHSNGKARPGARFGAVALGQWGVFLTTFTKHPGKKRWCTEKDQFVWVSAEKKKQRKRNREERNERERYVEELAAEGAKRVKRSNSPVSSEESEVSDVEGDLGHL